jgi:hypothetical protein
MQDKEDIVTRVEYVMKLSSIIVSSPHTQVLTYRTGRNACAHAWGDLTASSSRPINNAITTHVAGEQSIKQATHVKQRSSRIKLRGTISFRVERSNDKSETIPHKRMPYAFLPNTNGLKDLRPSRQSLWRMPSSGKWRRVPLIIIEVSVERIASIIRVERTGELGTTLAVTSNWRMLH